MERRRALAWAGSIALTVGASAIVLGSLVGGFDLGSPRAQEPEVSNGRPPGGATPRPAPGGTDPSPPVGGTDSGPGADGPDAQPAPAGGTARNATGGAQARRPPGSVPALRRYPSSLAEGGKVPASSPISPPSPTTGVSVTPVPQRDHGKPATSAVGTSPVAAEPTRQPACDVVAGDPTQPPSGSLWQLAMTATAVRPSGVPAGRDHRSGGSGQHGAVATGSAVNVSETWSVQLSVSVLGQPPGGDGTKTAAGEHAMKGRSNNDG